SSLVGMNQKSTKSQVQTPLTTIAGVLPTRLLAPLSCSEGKGYLMVHTLVNFHIFPLSHRKKLTERSEASTQVSEFSVNAEGEGEKVKLSDLLGKMEKTPKNLNKTKKQLKDLEKKSDTLELPLSRQEKEKIQREVAYVKTSTEVSRWESVVTQNRNAEQLVFPLIQEPSGPKRIEQVVSGWKAQTPLEQEIFSLLHCNLQPTHDPVLTPVEEASLKAMSLEEAKIRRAELQKARALQSYYEAKAKRERKIKSKKYHKVQSKAKRKEFLKKFEDLCKTDPQAALEEFKKMELLRMEERMSLKHQNSGKWAKSKVIMGKYDLVARKAMQEQLEMNKDLTQKLVVPSEDEEQEQEEPKALPDFVNDPEPVGDPANPWMRGQLSAEALGPEVSHEVERPTEQFPERKEEEEEEEPENEEEALLREFEQKRRLRQSEDKGFEPVVSEEQEVDEAENREAEEELSEKGEKDDEDGLAEFKNLFNRLVEPVILETGEEQGDEGLEEGLVRIHSLDDTELLANDHEASLVEPVPSDTSNMEASACPPSKNSKKVKVIDPSEVLTKQAKVIKVPHAPMMVEDEEVRNEQTTIIKEAFAGDDVVSDFLKDKRKLEEDSMPKVVDLTLPGWGEWGGVGLKPSRFKRRKFRIKPAPLPPRKDQKLPAVIISEKRNAALAAHQVCQLPFPFTKPEQFERTICSPVGNTWNTHNVMRKLTAPKVVTQMGAIIEPIAKDDFIKDKNPSKPQPNLQLTKDSSLAKTAPPGHKRRKK
uniref:U3 small nucleolar RNA-associated protein 14 n=1 Tax=Denticeps clupeoides TaxID=299321 RepID=A0AAY4BK03_9TELE